ncbi:MAG: hypothetical protein HW403_410, partial [Dehalococcoidia bacterium]|nr:hypothetical protein [Dehalococcoidia bacterium]
MKWTGLILLTLLIATAVVARTINAEQGSGRERFTTQALDAPTLTSPLHAARLTTLGPTLGWVNPTGTTQYHLQLTPFNGDGPGVDLHVGSPGSSLEIPPPPRWYGLLPDMTYTWRVRVSAASTFVALEDDSWSPWSPERSFRTPIRTSASISLMSPGDGAVVSTTYTDLRWGNSLTDAYYYELQVSGDPTFNVDPATATSFVWSNLAHG